MFRFASPLIALFIVLIPTGVKVARAQSISSRALEDISYEKNETGFAIRIGFSIPIFYLRHAPLERGDFVSIQLRPLAIPKGARIDPQRESIQVPRDFPLPLESVTLGIAYDAEPVVEVRFLRPVRYSVEQGEDLRSLIIRVPEAELRERGGNPPSASAAVPPPAPAPAEATGVDERVELMREGRRALTGEDYGRASALFTKFLSLPEGPDSPDALELLALSRERKGQLAHARAEYERYLEIYPSAPGAERVRQRLETLVTARADPPPRRSVVMRRPEQHPMDFEAFGSLYTAYRYDGRKTDDLGDETLESAAFTDVYTDSRLNFDSWSFRNQITGSYSHGFLEGGGDHMRANSLFIEAEVIDGWFAGSIGRRRKSTGGVLGRYDGGEITFRVGELVGIGAVAGLPVDSSSNGFEGFGRYFGGVNAEVGPLFGVLNVEFFAITQMSENLVDRMAVGTEIRYFDQGRSAFAFFDYDVHYQSLNTAQIVASWQPVQSTFLTLFGDYRNAPTLTTRNALQGQGVFGLDDLEMLFSRKQIEQLARDRTARSSSVSLSVSQILANGKQLALDVGMNHLSDTPASGGLDAILGTGFEFSYSAQFIANDVLTPGDVGVVGLKYFDGSAADILSGTLSGRYPLTRDLRLTPRIRADYRMQSGLNTIALQPSLRLDFTLGVLWFDMEIGAEWEVSGPQDGFEYFATCGVRYDF